MKLPFEIAGGTIIGSDHVFKGRNNQDALAWHAADGYTVAVVCDGCSGGSYSEFGSLLGARLVLKAVQSIWDGRSAPLEEVETCVLAKMKEVVMTFSGGMDIGWVDALEQYCLFTIVGVLVTEETTTIFSAGDGVYALNGEVKQIGPFQGNAPPYLAYNLIGGDKSPLVVNESVPTDSVQNILIGTDGLADFIAGKDDFLPGKTEELGPLSQFWTVDKYFKNPDMVRRRLALANRDVVLHQSRPHETCRVDRPPALLPDDTSLIVMRRRGT